MTTSPLILTLDQGTTSSRAIVFDQSGKMVSSAQTEFRQHYPSSGWVEHDAEDIWETTLDTAREALETAEARVEGTVACIGISNQRETTLAWDRRDGRPVAHGIVWQDRRTASFCEQLKAQGHEEDIQARTGLTIDPYFSATKLRWVLDNVEGARELAEQGHLAFGTVDTFLIYRLTGGKEHVTDETNASRTLLYNIAEGAWDKRLLEIFSIPESVLPEVRPSAAEFGEISPELLGRSLPIQGVAGDQQAAAFGQACWHPGMVKSTYGTGCFLLANTGNKLLHSKNRLLSTIACRTGAETQYAIEGSIFVAGAISQWLRDELGLVQTAAQTEALASGLDNNDGVYIVPAFTGLGAPHWNADARGMILGLTRASNRAVLARAALESVAYQTRDLLTALHADGLETERIRVDGGMTENNWFIQFLADILDTPIDRPDIIESTARGAAFLAGLQAGVFSSTEAIEALWKAERSFVPEMQSERRNALVSGWDKAVKTALFRASLDH
ncbi:glycerol kinase GlpK [Henriciella aquimarina]|uniref:glycerol kinase GlpK n=1 Tax=Henriciella aquimarina TaxID=545261 RepID=UPI000A01BD83|nr:glycerol kinase GlpK [Henriciella aquimarina]